MSWWPRLRPHQLELLSRIAEGRQPVTSREPALAATVYALRTRRLVTTPRSDGVWTAMITDAGQYYLEHGEYAGAGRPSPDAGEPTLLRARIPRRSRPEAAACAEEQRVPDARELIRVLQEQEAVRVADPPPKVRSAWRSAIRSLTAQGLVPAGYHLEHQGLDQGNLVVELVSDAYPGGRDGSDSRVAVPEVADTAVPVVRELRRHPDRLTVSAGSMPRALRLVQALAVEAGRRGWRVALTDDGSPGFVIHVSGRGYVVLMREEYDTRVVPDVDDVDDPKLYSWQRIPKRPRDVASGRLVLELADDAYRYRGRHRRWADRQRWRLEDKLGDVLAEVQARAGIDEYEQQAAERAEAERRRQWEQAMARARERFAEDYRVKVLDEQVSRWRRAQTIRDYATALQETGDADELPSDVAGWIGWVRAYADSIDPLLSASRVPDVPEPRPEDLRPYLKGLSPYGPDRGY